MKAKIEKNYSVEYAHRLPLHQGQCRFIHGHSGKVKVVFEGTVDNKTGMVVDFGEFSWLKKIIEEFDHALILMKTDKLCDYLLKGVDEGLIDPLSIIIMEGSPTAENILMYIMNKILENPDFRLLNKNSNYFVLWSVTFEETVGNAATVEAL